MTNLDVRGPSGVIGTASLTVTDRDVDVAATLAALVLTLPAGRFLIRSIITSTPAIGRQAPAGQSLDTTLAAPGTATLPAVTYHALKDFESGVGGSVIAQIDVQRWTGTAWVGYATSWTPNQGVAFAAAPAARTDQLRGANLHIFGTNVDSTRMTRLLDAAVDLGMDIVCTAAPWPYLEQSAQGSFNATTLAQLDAFFAAVASRSLKALVTIGGSAPPWASTGAVTATVTWSGQTIQAKAKPDNWADFQTFATWLANRYGNQGLYAVQPSNEPNLNGVSAADEVNWTKYLYQGIKASTYPTVKIVGAVTEWADASYLASLYTAGLKGWCDAVACHPYPYASSPSFHRLDVRVPHSDAEFSHHPAAVGAFREAVVAATDTVPVWVTEMGAVTGAAAGVSFSESGQADALRYLFRLLARVPNVDAVVMHTLEDVGDTNVSPDPFYQQRGEYGLLRLPAWLARKPAYATVKQTLAGLKAGTA